MKYSSRRTKFGVSRTLVREAIQRFVVTSTVQVRQRKGTVIIQLTIPRLIGMIEIMTEFDFMATDWPRGAPRRMSVMRSARS